MKKHGLHSYEVRTGGDDKVGIYLRAYNVRAATFNSNSSTLQELLKVVFNEALRKESEKHEPEH